jgi:hypothetical protein
MLWFRQALEVIWKGFVVSLQKFKWFGHAGHGSSRRLDYNHEVF